MVEEVEEHIVKKRASKPSTRKLDGLCFPSPACSQSPSGAHYYIVTVADVWQCKYCRVPVWMPIYWDDAEKLQKLKLKYRDIQTAYKVALSYRPKTAKILRALVAANKIMEANK